MKSKLVLFIFLMTYGIFKTQNSDLGVWMIPTIQYKYNHKWSGTGEIQGRFNSFFHDLNYLEIKGLISYKLNSSYSFSLGFGRYKTYEKQVVTDKEFRIWEQAVYLHFYKSLRLDHRLRIEQRFVDSDYDNRFRYRLNATLPLNNKKMDINTLFVSAYDELFFADHAPLLTRNRLYLGLGYQFTENINAQFGVVHQHYYNGLTKDKANLVFGFNYSLARKNKKNKKNEAPILDQTAPPTSSMD